MKKGESWDGCRFIHVCCDYGVCQNQMFGGYRKLSASELIWRMLRTSYGIEGGAQNAD